MGMNEHGNYCRSSDIFVKDTSIASSFRKFWEMVYGSPWNSEDGQETGKIILFGVVIVSFHFIQS
jgi:hypothetical protein